MKAASIVVVGGGIMGASVAWHLARRGWRDLVILDRSAAPGLGSTGAATGGFRVQFETPIDVRLSLLARRKLLRFEDEVGVDPGYRQAGYLWLADRREDLEALRSALAVQRAEGVTEAIELGHGEIARHNPAVRPDGLLGGAFCPSDGFIRPRSMLQGYLDAAARLGVRIEWGLEATGVTRASDGRITAVTTTRGALAAGAVVNAAGAWAGALARDAELDPPVIPLRRQVAVTLPCDLLPEAMPMTIFTGDGFHLRVRDGRVLLLWPTPGAAGRPFGVEVEDDWVAAVARAARARIPILGRAVVDRPSCWAGLYEMSPDRHAILGAAPRCPNLYYINGSSGHGVMHAPALGQLLAEIISDGAASSIDVTALRPDRFGSGAAPAPAGLL
ncbi:MAG TPA: FAD-dependent oxidoreductase [Patescibacteria group bacterium]|nr:FAD-dependent oxidoreductase [Patescibacteria group bacterium]